MPSLFDIGLYDKDVIDFYYIPDPKPYKKGQSGYRYRRVYRSSTLGTERAKERANKTTVK